MCDDRIQISKRGKEHNKYRDGRGRLNLSVSTYIFNEFN